MKKTGVYIADFVLVMALLGVAAGFYSRTRHWQVAVRPAEFTETADYLPNADRGFYYIYGFYLSDEDTDFRTQVLQRFACDTDTTLAMIQINLQNYRKGAISEKGLQHLEELFEALEETGKHYLVRFLYDWDGENLQKEPEKLEIILGHIRQTGEVLRKHKQKVFVIQGLYIGNWGEMNGSRYLTAEDFQRLAGTLAESSDPSDYMAVRMPSQWRTITGQDSPDVGEERGGTLKRRLSLFNDGIMGNESDYGTYGIKKAGEAAYYEPWCRQDELEFQNELCKWVPNGGEIIVENPYNDFENALRDLGRMHITYLNRDYDSNIFKKWEKTIIQEPGCFEGMDGLTYMERHLGYRILIREASLFYDREEDSLSAEVSLQNTGFAPVYTDKNITMTLCSEDGENLIRKQPDFDLRALSGGDRADETASCQAVFSLSRLPKGRYSLYFQIEDAETGELLLLANEQKRERDGYAVGEIEIIR